MRYFAFLLAAGLALSQGKQGGVAGIDWNKPFPPHKVIGNVYFVGSEQLGSYLITTPAGHILVNTDFEETVPVIRAAVEKLGFKFTDIKIVLGSHAHPDHMSGDALVKELTAARVMAMEQDVPALKNLKPGGKEHPIDRVLKDGDTVELGGTTLVAHLTPGHTKGCTTWTLKIQDGGKTCDVVIVGSVSLNAAVLVDNKNYPQIQDDYIHSFQVLKGLHCDVFLASHTGMYKMAEKYAAMEKDKTGANPFIDPEGYKAHVESSEKAFYARLK
jgi:metallo-beta-lactamase class B